MLPDLTYRRSSIPQAENSWALEGEPDHKPIHSQAAVRWYASGLGDPVVGSGKPKATGVPDHRRSSDISVDRAVGNAIASQQVGNFEKLSEEERRMLFWNLKNVEYALGANLSALSMKFWDIDERHAFEGDHVLLRQGYSTVVNHLLQQLLSRGRSFRNYLNCPVGKIEYSRKTTSQTYAGSCRRLQLIDLSDTCCVTSEDGRRSINCDFVVCAVPLGVLKEAMVKELDDEDKPTPERGHLKFAPSLPFLKRDAIESVGFGLLDKVYLQFPWAFWRTGDCRLTENQFLFGNASGLNPHHYMFFDIGKILGKTPNPPAILMSLISGKEAVKCENLTQDEVVKEAMDTLRTLFSGVRVPQPMATQVTRWGSDRFSRGSYTFLPPGATDQDFQSLQSPVNGNGDSLLLEGSETMRLFFAGEHTTQLHPSMAHGAMLSGVRAGAEVFEALSLNFKTDETIDRMIPMSFFRHKNPEASLQCAFCNVSGTRAYEGPLLAFKRGSRQVLVHNSCAEYSPEVEVSDGHWKNVLKAVNRSAALACHSCGQYGASIGCNNDHCQQSYHFACAEGTGWKFEDDGKEFYCEAHRPSGAGTGPKRPHPNQLGSKDNFQHTLFASLSGEDSQDGGSAPLVFSNPDVQTKATPPGTKDPNDDAEDDRAAFSTIGQLTSDLDAEYRNAFLSDSTTRLVRLTRESLRHRWDVELMTQPLASSPSSGSKKKKNDRSLLIVSKAHADDPFDPTVKDAVVISINGSRVGSSDLDTIDKVISQLGQEVDVMMEVVVQQGTGEESDAASSPSREDTKDQEDGMEDEEDEEPYEWLSSADVKYWS